MALVIRASTFCETRVLKVESWGVTHVDACLIGGRRTFGFGEIECILMSVKHVLSFQVGDEVFSVATKPGNRRHQKTIEALVDAVRAAHGLPPGGRFFGVV